MSVEVHSIIRSVSDLSSNEKFVGLENVDRLTIQDPAIIDAYQHNPFLGSAEQPAELVGVVEGKIIGSIGVMPMRMVADGCEYETSANPGIQVDPEYRKTGYALDLIEFGTKNSKHKIRLDFYVSRTARKVMKLWGGAVFDIAQFAIVRRSSLFFAERMPSLIAPIVCIGLDVLFFFHRICLKGLLRIKTHGWRMECADDDGSLQEFSDLISRDPHRFRNHVSVPFLRWILNHDFRGVSIADKHLWRFVKDDDTLGFVLMRKDHRGRGRIIDWQATTGNDKCLPWMLLRSAFRLLATTRAVVISVSACDSAVVRCLSRLCPRLPVQAATVAIGQDSPLSRHKGWREQVNWRIRPTMGDSGLY